MHVISKIVNIKKTIFPTVDYIENELTKRNINPLRWAVVNVSDTMYTVSVADIKDKEE